jgi:lysozyme
VSNIRDLISTHEGRIPYAYQDSLGYWTIGVGHLIDHRKGGALPESIIDALLDYDIQEKRSHLDAALPWAAALDEVRYAVLLDMCFNLGIQGLLGFTHFLASVQDGQYELASAQMLQSKWATQVKSRATHLSDMMRTGQW